MPSASVSTAVAENSGDLLSDRSEWRASRQSASGQIVRKLRTDSLVCVRTLFGAQTEITGGRLLVFQE